MYQLALPYRRNALILQRNLELKEDSNLASIMLYHSVAEPGSDEKITPEHFHCPKRCDDDIDDGGGCFEGNDGGYLRQGAFGDIISYLPLLCTFSIFNGTWNRLST